jgi:methionine-rich copper-binding protein CopC
MTRHSIAVSDSYLTARGRVGRGAALALLVVVAMLLAPALALAHPAHARFHSSDPSPNQILKVAPNVVTIHFEEAVNPQGSDIVVFDATGKQVSTAPAQVSRTDLKTMTVTMRGTGAEIYLVVWHNVSADDGDPDTGAFTFLVNPKAATVQAVTGSSGQRAAGAAASGVPIWLAVLLAVLGLAVAAGAAWYATTHGMIGARGAGR